MRLIGIFVKIFVFFLTLFAIGRLVFLMVYFRDLSEIYFPEILLSFLYAIQLDISTALFAISIPFILFIGQLFWNRNFTSSLINAYINILIILVGLIYSAEIAVYKDWGVKLHYKVFIHLKNPTEMLHTAHFGHYLTYLISFFTIIILGLIIYRKYFRIAPFQVDRYISNAQGMFWFRIYHLLICLLVLGIMIIGLRGGLQPIPINQSVAFYSKHVILNDAAVNPLWNLAHSTIGNSVNINNSNPYIYHKQQDALSIVKKIHQRKINNTNINSLRSSSKILKNNRPNIVLIILESWSADIVGSLGGLTGITPEFDRLAKDGLLFSKVYASGYTSDLAMPAIFSSSHALPIASIITQPSKFKKLHCLSKSFNDIGYFTSYHFGGQLIYGNIKGFLYHHQFEEIIEQKDLSNDLPAGKLGIHDEYMFDVFLENLNQKGSNPFFSTLFTLSTHPPYDMPINKFKYFDDYENEYLNAANYTDSCLGLFFDRAKKQKWYDNTLFVVVADHSHHTPMKWRYCEPGHYKIPLLLYGNVIKKEYRGSVNENLGSQVDIAPTILNQMDLPDNKFPWGKNLLDTESPQFAFYTFYDGFGWIRPYGSFAYEKRYEEYFHKVLQDTTKEEELIKEGQAYIQTVFQEYLDY